MTEVLIWVSKFEQKGSDVLLIGEPLISTTGIADNQAEFVGDLNAVSYGNRLKLGRNKLRLRLGVDSEMSWECDFRDLPAPSFLLTDGDSKRVVFDGCAKLTNISPILQHRLSTDDWDYAGFLFGNFVGVMENCGKGIESVRVVLIGESSDRIECKLQMRDIDDVEEILAIVELKPVAVI